MQYILLREQTRRVALTSTKQASVRVRRVVFIPLAVFLVPYPEVEKRHACPVSSSSFLLTGTPYFLNHYSGDEALLLASPASRLAGRKSTYACRIQSVALQSGAATCR
jgi:hypothetical protein